MITQASLIEQGNFQQRMPKEKMEAYSRELPWLATWMDDVARNMDVGQVVVSDIDVPFAEYRPITVERHYRPQDRRDNTFYCVGLETDPVIYFEAVWFLDKNGCTVRHEAEMVMRKYLFFGPRLKGVFGAVARDSSQTLGEFMTGLGDNVIEAKYAVSYCDYTKTVIAYIPATGMNSIFEHLLVIGGSYSERLATEVKTEIAGVRVR